MNYAAFREKVKKYPFFRSNIFPHITDNVSMLRRQVSEWVSKGYIVQLKRGMYTLRTEDRLASLSVYFLANNLYSPSYISLETALSHYGFIPERVNAITSVSTKKTQRFTNFVGNFIYHNVKLSMYGNFIAEQDEFGNKFFIATPEKAIIDFLYFKVKEIANLNEDIFDSSFRFQHLEMLNKKKLKKIVKEIQQNKLTKLIELLMQQF
jgi:hypothetical protein